MTGSRSCRFAANISEQCVWVQLWTELSELESQSMGRGMTGHGGDRVGRREDPRLEVGQSG